MSGEPKVPDVDGSPTSRSEANSLRIQRMEEDVFESLERVEEALNELHRRIDRNEQRIRRLELYIGEFGAGDDDE